MVARTSLQIAIDYRSEGLRGNLLFDHALEHTNLAAQNVWLLLVALTLLGRGKRASTQWLRAFAVGAGALYFVGGLQATDEPQYLPGYESWRGFLGWAVVLSFAGLLAWFDSRLTRPDRLVLRGPPTLRFSMTAVLLLVGGGALLAAYQFVEAERRFIVLEGTPQDGDLIRRFRSLDGVEVEGSVELDTIAPQAGYAESGGSRESLVLRPGASVNFQLQPRGSSDLVFAFAADLDKVLAVERLPSGLDPELRLEVEVDGERRFSRTLHPVGRKDDRRWFDARIPLEDTGGEPVKVRFALESADVGARLLRGAVAEPAIHRTERVARRTTSSDRWNVVVLCVDSLRTDRLSTYGAAVSRMPFVDEALVPRSTVYERAIAPSSWVWPSVATLFTGLAPPVHGVVDELHCVLPDPVLTLAERMQFLGITTGGWTTNPLIARDKKFDQGFSVWREFAQKNDFLIVREFQDFLARYKDFQFFCYVHLSATRGPYRPSDRQLQAVLGKDADRSVNRDIDERALVLAQGDDSARPDPEELRKLEGLYDAAALTVDSTVAALWDSIWRAKLLDRTVVVLTAPHGEEFLEHGLLQHGWSLDQPSIHVPLIVRCPWNEVPARIAEPVELGGLAGTILGWVGFTERYHSSSAGLPPFHPLGPMPLAFSVTQRGAPGLELGPRWASVQSQHSKLLRDLRSGTDVFYDLEDDPGELHPLSADVLPEAAILRTKLQKWFETQALQRERLGTEPEPSPLFFPGDGRAESESAEKEPGRE